MIDPDDDGLDGHNPDQFDDDGICEHCGLHFDVCDCDSLGDFMDTMT